MRCSKLVRGRRLGRRSFLFTAGPLALASLQFEPVTSFIRLYVASPELAVPGYTAKRAELDQYAGRHALLSLELQNIFGWSGENTREEQISSQRRLPIELKRHFSRPLRDPSIFTGPPGFDPDITQIKKIRQSYCANIATAIRYQHVFPCASGGSPCWSSARSSAPDCMHFELCFQSAMV